MGNIDMQHLTRDIISQYINGSLNSKEVREVEHHLNQCDFCSDAMDGYAAFPEALSEKSLAEISKDLQASTNRNTTMTSRKIWIPVAASLVLIMSFIVIFNRYQVDAVFTSRESPGESKQEISAPSSDRVSQEEEVMKSENAQQSNSESLTMKMEEGAESARKVETSSAEPKIQKTKPTDEQLNTISANDTELDEDEIIKTEALGTTDEDSDEKETAIEVQREPEVREESQALNGSGIKNSAGQPIQPVERKEAVGLALNLNEPPIEEMVSDPGEPVKEVGDIPSVQPQKSRQPVNAAAARSLMPADEIIADHEKIVISGEVTAASDGTPLIGVNVFVKGSSIGTKTDTAGQFTLQLPPGKQEVMVALVGYLAEEYVIDQNEQLEVELEEDLASLAEVVVVGYATSKKEDLSYKPPAPVNGMKAFRKYVDSNLKHPAGKEENGKVKVAFYVEPNGNLRDFRIVKGMGEPYDQEAIRVIREGPEWEPAQKNGMPYREQKMVTIRF